MAPRGKILTRKNRRKEERAAKKQRRVQYYSRQVQNNKTESKGTSKKTQYPPLPIGHDTKAPPSKKKAWLIKANEKEQKEISKLEKLLKINKRKKDENRWPNSFHEDGLDCIFYFYDCTSSMVTCCEACSSPVSLTGPSIAFTTRDLEWILPPFCEPCS